MKSCKSQSVFAFWLKSAVSRLDAQRGRAIMSEENSAIPTKFPPKRRRVDLALTPPKVSEPDPPGDLPLSQRRLFRLLWEALEMARRYDSPARSEAGESDTTLELGR